VLQPTDVWLPRTAEPLCGRPTSCEGLIFQLEGKAIFTPRGTLELLVQENYPGVRRLDSGEYRSSFKSKVLIGQMHALPEASLSRCGLRVVSCALGHAPLEAAVAREVCAETKESSRNAPVGKLTARSYPTIQRSTAFPRAISGILDSYASSTVRSASAIGRKRGTSSNKPSGMGDL
jgi:hypothetical protein